MITYKTDAEIELIRTSCLLVSKALAEVAKVIKPGISGKKLDTLAEEVIRDHGGQPGFKGYNGFPATLCISINEQVVHGIPSEEPLKEGDIASIDCGVLMNGYYGDSAYTFAIGEIPFDWMKLLSVTKASLYAGIEKAVAGNRLGDIGFAVQNLCEKQHNYGVIRELVGHGIGSNLHEPPEVPNYGKRGRGIKLKEGMVIAIEPMINLGSRKIMQSTDGWTIITKDKKPSAHFEHSVAIRKKKADILSNHSMIDLAIKNNLDVAEISIKS